MGRIRRVVAHERTIPAATDFREYTMNLRTTLATLLLVAPLAAGSAIAQEGPYAPVGMRHADATSYGYAAVLRADPIYETVRTTHQEQRCGDDGDYRRPDNGDTTAGTVIGAVIGGALGNTVGKGDGRRAATIAGAVAGGAIGHHVASNNNSGDNGGPCHLVDVDRDERRITGYDVEYNYKGDIYAIRMAYNPGNRLRVRVTVVPDDREAPPVGY
jgi:uncharacterized protein YcfJ